jgi:protein-S-isoprenylcysteine O-methyltransferase Ste14
VEDTANAKGQIGRFGESILQTMIRKSAPPADIEKGSRPSNAMKTGLVIRSVISVLALPVMVAGVLPGWLLLTRGGAIGASLPKPINLIMAAAGLTLTTLGLFLAVGAIRRFSTEGEGTLAPWDPPRRLVVRGTYRYVRHPMISGVLIILAGEAIFFGSMPIFEWFVFFAVLNAIYIPFIEEPMLVGRFGHDYLSYQKHVPRWLPRLTPWNPGK